MKLKGLLLSLNLFASILAMGQSIMFDYSYDYIPSSGGCRADFYQSPDSGFVIASIADVVTGPYVFRTDKFGVVKWSRSYPSDTSLSTWISIAPCFDNGTIVCTSKHTVSCVSGDCFSIAIFKLDYNGTLLWAKEITEPTGRLNGGNIQQTTDSGYMVTGIINDDYYLAKLNSNGNMVWDKSYDHLNQKEALASAQQTSDGGYVLAGTTLIGRASNVFVVKTDNLGNQQWNKEYTWGLEENELYDFHQVFGGGYICTGLTEDSLSGRAYHSFVMELSSNGSVNWARVYRPTFFDYGCAIDEAHGGGYICVMDIGTTNGLQRALAKLNGNGTVQWMRQYDFGANPTFTVHRTSDGGYASTSIWGGGLKMLKTDGQGNTITCHDSLFFPETEFLAPVISSALTVGSGGSLQTINLTDSIIVTTHHYSCPETPLELSIPNVFSPNGDGLNDIFFIHLVGYKKYHIKIYNRWGAEVFRSDDINQQWNGLSFNSGEEVSDGTYYCVVSVYNPNTGEEENYKGYLTLLRHQ